MPSFLGRLFGVSFRTERLIMNLLGLVNSTLDWSSIKWTNKLEQIWNLSLSQGTLILDVIGEDAIKTVLSWIVIMRIVIAHVYTFSYMTNIYPILTWSRPNLLLPWLILSFFKNVVLEVIVIAVGLLLWYDKRFSLPIFLEFVLVKVVPLIFATYNWYSNSCLFLELHHIEKLRKLRRNMRSDSNLLAARLYFKIVDSKYRTRSLTTLVSYDSYETYDTPDTISRIFDDPHLSPAQKTMRILCLSEQDIDEARTRIKEREIRRRLTEEEDELFMRSTRDMSRYFSFVSEYDWSMMKALQEVKDELGKQEDTKNEIVNDEVIKDEVSNDEIIKNEILNDEIIKNETLNDEIIENEILIDEIIKDELPNDEFMKDNIEIDEVINSNLILIQDNPSASSIRSELTESTRGSKDNFEDVDTFARQNSSSKKRGGTDSPDMKRKQIKMCPSSHKDFKQSGSFSKKRDSISFCCSRHTRRSVEKSCYPVKLQALFNCNCIVDEYLFKENMEEYCLASSATMRTSTPNRSPDKQMMIENTENDSEDTKNKSEQPCVNDCNDVGESTDIGKSNDLPLIEKLLNNDLDILKNITKDDQRFENNLTLQSKSTQEVFKVSERESSVFSKLYTGQCSASVGVQNLSEIVKDLSVTRNVKTNFETTKTIEPEKSGMKSRTEIEIPRTMISTSVIGNGAGSIQRSSLDSGRQGVEKNVLKVNLSEYSFGDINIPRFYKDSMKVFDGCYEKDFANNTELQCLLQQLEKKKWSMFPGQPSQEMLIPSVFLKENDEGNRSTVVEGFETAPSATDFEKIESRHKISVSSTSKFNYQHLLSQIVQVNEQSVDDASSTLNDIRKLSFSNLPTKDGCTQTDNDDHPRTSSISLAEAKQSILKDHPKHSRQKPTKPNDRQKKQPSLTKSVSDKSVCECKTQQTESKHSTSSESKYGRKEKNRKCAAKCKVENFGTIPLSQVVRPSMFDTVIHRRKPPVYPKKIKNEVPVQNSGSNAKLQKTSALKKLLEVSKRPPDKQSAHNSKRFKWKGRKESLEEQEAREMRALKAYNEVTLLVDKKELETRKKLPSRRNYVDPSSESSRSRPSSRNGNHDRSKKDVSRNIESVYGGYLDKENLFADATTETEPLLAVPAKDSKAFGAAGKFNVSSEKHSCAKLSKVNKVTDKLLDNFDRLHGSQSKQNPKKNRQTAETDARKRYTKYSKPTKSIDEENVSIVSMKKLEGIQRGRELERTPAKEDVRNQSVACTTSSIANELVRLDSHEGRADMVKRSVTDDHGEEASTSVDGVNVGIQNGDLLTMLKTTTIKDVVSSCSSSTVDQGDDLQLQVQDDLNTANETQTILEIEDHKKEVQKVQKIEDRKEEVQKVQKIEDRKEKIQTLEIEDHEREVYAVPETEDHKLEVEAIPEVEDHKTEIEPISEVEQGEEKQIETPPVPDNAFSAHPIESTNHEEEVKSEAATEETGSQSLEVSQNESARTSATPSTNATEFIRNIDMNYVANGVILSNSSAPTRNSPRLWDIVDDDTVRTLHNAFSYRSADTTFDLSGDILTAGDLLNNINNRRLESSIDELIFDLSTESMGDSMEELPPQSREENSFEQTIMATIRQFQNLDLGNHERVPCDLLIATINHRGLPISFEMETVEQFDDAEETEHPDINELRIDDVLSTMAGIVWDLNSGELNFENLSEAGFQILPEESSPLDDDDDDETEQIEEDDEEEFEETNERSMVEEWLLQLIKEDIFTDIKFPIVARLNDGLSNALAASNEEPEELNITLDQAEPSKINLFTLFDDEDEEQGDETDEVVVEEIIQGRCNEEIKKAEHPRSLRKVQEPVSTAPFSRQFLSVSDYQVAENVLNDEKEAFYFGEASTRDNPFANLLSIFKNYTTIPSESVEIQRNSASKDILDKTHELFDETDEVNEIDEKETSSKDEMIREIEEIYKYEELEEDTHRVIDESVSTEIKENINFNETETADENIQPFELERTANKEVQITECEEMLDLLEEKQEEDMSLKIIFSFWLLVFVFYIQYFYQKIFSFRHVTTSTSTLKPFEIHTVPTSTTMLFENSKIVQKIAEETEETEEVEENDSSERIVDLEVVEVSRSDKHHSLNLDPIVRSTLSNSLRIEDSFEKSEDEVEKIISRDSEHISGNVEILSFSTSDENNLKEYNIHDSSNTELQNREIRSAKFLDLDLQLQKLDEINVNEVSSITESEEQRLLELRLAGEEIEAFRFKEDDDSSSSISLSTRDDETKLIDNTESYFIRANAEVKEEAKEVKEWPNFSETTEELLDSDSSRKQDSTFSIDEERCNESNKEENSASDQTGDRDGIISSKHGVDEVKSTEENESSSSSKIFETDLQINDSFNSTYITVSNASRNNISMPDLNDSSMEEFTIASNELS